MCSNRAVARSSRRDFHTRELSGYVPQLNWFLKPYIKGKYTLQLYSLSQWFVFVSYIIKILLYVGCKCLVSHVIILV